MDSVVRLTNYFEHPEDNRYMVYVFFLKTHADFFQNLLEDRNVEYERYLDPDSERQRILFGVSKRFQKEANKSNFLTHAEFRRPFIRNKAVGILFMVITFSVVALAIFGYLKSGK